MDEEECFKSTNSDRGETGNNPPTDDGYGVEDIFDEAALEVECH